MTTILITAGEASGDRLGAALMEELKKHHKNLHFIGVGGAEMEKQGLKSAFPMAELAVMGLAEVVPSIPRILRRLNELARLADREGPALAITIDAQDFSKRLAAKLQHLPLSQRKVPVIQYVAPKVWAWRPGRVKKLRRLFTHLLTILPFEGPFFKESGIPTTYVGHPALTTLAPYMPAQPQTLQSSNPQTLALALLPGSRGAEFKRHWPLLLETFRRLKKLHPQLGAVLAVPNEKALHTCYSLAAFSEEEGIQPVFGEERFQALTQCRAALAKSGTNNLELALLGIPAVVCYRMNALSWWLAQRLVTVPYVSLPNLILNPQALGKKYGAPGIGAPVYPEFLQNGANPQNLARALHPLLTEDKPRQHQLKLLEKMRAEMQTPQPPAQTAAAIILSYLK